MNWGSFIDMIREGLTEKMKGPQSYLKEAHSREKKQQCKGPEAGIRNVVTE
jgi:hypothetical protein